MASSAFQIEDQTDEEFFDKLVDDEFDGSQSKSDEINRVFSNLSMGDGSASLDDSGVLEIASKGEITENGVVLKCGDGPKKDLLVSEGSLHLETPGLFDSDKGHGASPGLSTVKNDVSKGTSVKVVQWTAFSVDSLQEFEKVDGFEPYSEFHTEDSDGFFETPVDNICSNLGSIEQQDTQFNHSTNEQTANQNDPQYWENLYPGWKFDSTTMQWYQDDSYDATTEAQFNNLTAASAESVSQSSYLQQSSQSVLETIAEECTVSSVSNWNKAPEGRMEYPSNMVFDPQYPGWYYDTNTQNWYTIESYNQGLANNSIAVEDQLSDAIASAGLNSDQNHSLYSNVGQSEAHVFQGDTGQEFGHALDPSRGIYTQQSSLSSNINPSAQHSSQNRSSRDFGSWDASIGNYDQKNVLYNNTGQSDQMTMHGWGSQQFGQNRNASMGNLAEQNSIYINSMATTHPTTQSLGSHNFGQNWDASSASNHAQQDSVYSNASYSMQHSNKAQDIQVYEGNWEASRNIYAQGSMWQPQLVGTNAHTTGFSGNQQTRSSYGSIPESSTIQGVGVKAFEPVTRKSYGSINDITGFQSISPKESVHKFDQPKVDETLHLSNSYYGDQNVVYPQQPFQDSNASYSQFSYTHPNGRLSSGRPPHPLVTFGFGGKLIIMKNGNSLGANLGNQESAGSTISVLSLSEVVADKGDGSGIVNGTSHDYFHALCLSSFPGPLVGGSAATKDINKWIDEKIGKCESASIDFREGEFLKLLFSLLKIMCQHYGKLRSPFGSDPSLEEIDGPESAVTRLFASAGNNGARLTEFSSLTHCMRNLPSEGQIRATAVEVQNLLVSGRRKEALQHAQEGQLWGPALVLAAQLGEKFYVDTVKKMAQCQFISGSPLRTLCLLIAGQPADIFSADSTANNFPRDANGPHGPTQVLANSMLDEWEKNLAIITANRTKDDELVIIHLGDCLLKERRKIIAAHTCYLVAEANFESYSDSARLCLIGADHWKCPRTFVSPEAIQRTEVYEYSKVLGNSQFVLQPFQPYKVVYAYMLAEVGKVSESLRYCQSSLKLLKNSGRAPEVETLTTLLSSLEERLRTHQQGGYGSDLAPAKLVGKLFTSIDRSIHRMIGAPPAPLPPTPQLASNSKDNFYMAPNVASSHSTMTMSSLMPSQSVEAISEWSGDGGMKPMHNRSISEPDFGRTPKQNSTKDAGSVDGQSKSLASPSRLGLIGSQLLQKTVGWVSRSRPDHQAKLGESNKFYYDEKLKRWVEEGAEPPAEEAAPPPPPTKAVFQNGALDYSINGAFTNPGHANGGPETKASFPLEPNAGIPPIPPSQNQFSARGRMGVRSRYVDTFNKGGGGGGGGGGLMTNSFQSPAAAPVKPAIGTKFFVPISPAPSDEQKHDPMGETIQGPTPDEVSSSLPSTSSPSSLQRFPSVDNISPSINKAAASHSSNGSLFRTRAASWSGAYSDTTGQRLAGAKMGLTSISLFSLAFLFFFPSSSPSAAAPVSVPVNPHPQEFPFLKIREPHQLARGCSYTVKIKTSCSSPRYTRDYISIAFGDAYHNEVHVPRLDNPSSHTFERCSTDTFKIQGPCGYGVCYLYLMRDGYDGWMPESVAIYEVNYRRSVNFYYNTPLPNAVWYGFNHCPRIVATNTTEAVGASLISEM